MESLRTSRSYYDGGKGPKDAAQEVSPPVAPPYYYGSSGQTTPCMPAAASTPHMSHPYPGVLAGHSSAPPSHAASNIYSGYPPITGYPPTTQRDMVTFSSLAHTTTSPYAAMHHAYTAPHARPPDPRGKGDTAGRARALEVTRVGPPHTFSSIESTDAGQTITAHPNTAHASNAAHASVGSAHKTDYRLAGVSSDPQAAHRVTSSSSKMHSNRTSHPLQMHASHPPTLIKAEEPVTLSASHYQSQPHLRPSGVTTTTHTKERSGHVERHFETATAPVPYAIAKRGEDPFLSDHLEESYAQIRRVENPFAARASPITTGEVEICRQPNEAYSATERRIAAAAGTDYTYMNGSARHSTKAMPPLVSRTSRKDANTLPYEDMRQDNVLALDLSVKTVKQTADSTAPEPADLSKSNVRSSYDEYNITAPTDFSRVVRSHASSTKDNPYMYAISARDTNGILPGIPRQPPLKRSAERLSSMERPSKSPKIENLRTQVPSPSKHYNYFDPGISQSHSYLGVSDYGRSYDGFSSSHVKVEKNHALAERHIPHENKIGFHNHRIEREGYPTQEELKSEMLPYAQKNSTDYQYPYQAGISRSQSSHTYNTNLRLSSADANKDCYLNYYNTYPSFQESTKEGTHEAPIKKSNSNRAPEGFNEIRVKSEYELNTGIAPHFSEPRDLLRSAEIKRNEIGRPTEHEVKRVEPHQPHLSPILDKKLYNLDEKVTRNSPTSTTDSTATTNSVDLKTITSTTYQISNLSESHFSVDNLHGKNLPLQEQNFNSDLHKFETIKNELNIKEPTKFCEEQEIKKVCDVSEKTFKPIIKETNETTYNKDLKLKESCKHEEDNKTTFNDDKHINSESTLPKETCDQERETDCLNFNDSNKVDIIQKCSDTDNALSLQTKLDKSENSNLVNEVLQVKTETNELAHKEQPEINIKDNKNDTNIDQENLDEMKCEKGNSDFSELKKEANKLASENSAASLELKDGKQCLSDINTISNDTISKNKNKCEKEIDIITPSMPKGVDVKISENLINNGDFQLTSELSCKQTSSPIAELCNDKTAELKTSIVDSKDLTEENKDNKKPTSSSSEEMEDLKVNNKSKLTHNENVLNNEADTSEACNNVDKLKGYNLDSKILNIDNSLNVTQALKQLPENNLFASKVIIDTKLDIKHISGVVRNDVKPNGSSSPNIFKERLLQMTKRDDSARASPKSTNKKEDCAKSSTVSDFRTSETNKFDEKKEIECEGDNKKDKNKMLIDKDESNKQDYLDLSFSKEFKIKKLKNEVVDVSEINKTGRELEETDKSNNFKEDRSLLSKAKPEKYLHDLPKASPASPWQAQMPFVLQDLGSNDEFQIQQKLNPNYRPSLTEKDYENVNRHTNNAQFSSPHPPQPTKLSIKQIPPAHSPASSHTKSYAPSQSPALGRPHSEPTQSSHTAPPLSHSAPPQSSKHSNKPASSDSAVGRLPVYKPQNIYEEAHNQSYSRQSPHSPVHPPPEKLRYENPHYPSLASNSCAITQEASKVSPHSTSLPHIKKQHVADNTPFSIYNDPSSFGKSRKLKCEPSQYPHAPQMPYPTTSSAYYDSNHYPPTSKSEFLDLSNNPYAGYTHPPSTTYHAMYPPTTYQSQFKKEPNKQALPYTATTWPYSHSFGSQPTYTSSDSHSPRYTTSHSTNIVSHPSYALDTARQSTSSHPLQPQLSTHNQTPFLSSLKSPNEQLSCHKDSKLNKSVDRSLVSEEHKSHISQVPNATAAFPQHYPSTFTTLTSARGSRSTTPHSNNPSPCLSRSLSPMSRFSSPSGREHSRVFGSPPLNDSFAPINLTATAALKKPEKSESPYQTLNPPSAHSMKAHTTSNSHLRQYPTEPSPNSRSYHGKASTTAFHLADGSYQYSKSSSLVHDPNRIPSNALSKPSVPLASHLAKSGTPNQYSMTPSPNIDYRQLPNSHILHAKKSVISPSKSPVPGSSGRPNCSDPYYSEYHHDKHPDYKRFYENSAVALNDPRYDEQKYNKYISTKTNHPEIKNEMKAEIPLRYAHHSDSQSPYSNSAYAINASAHLKQNTDAVKREIDTPTALQGTPSLRQVDSKALTGQNAPNKGSQYPHDSLYPFPGPSSHVQGKISQDVPSSFANTSSGLSRQSNDSYTSSITTTQGHYIPPANHLPASSQYSYASHHPSISNQAFTSHRSLPSNSHHSYPSHYSVPPTHGQHSSATNYYPPTHDVTPSQYSSNQYLHPSSTEHKPVVDYHRNYQTPYTNRQAVAPSAQHPPPAAHLPSNAAHKPPHRFPSPSQHSRAPQANLLSFKQGLAPPTSYEHPQPPTHAHHSESFKSPYPNHPDYPQTINRGTPNAPNVATSSQYSIQDKLPNANAQPPYALYPPSQHPHMHQTPAAHHYSQYPPSSAPTPSFYPERPHPHPQPHVARTGQTALSASTDGSKCRLDPKLNYPLKQPLKEWRQVQQRTQNHLDYSVHKDSLKNQREVKQEGVNDGTQGLANKIPKRLIKKESVEGSDAEGKATLAAGGKEARRVPPPTEEDDLNLKFDKLMDELASHRDSITSKKSRVLGRRYQQKLQLQTAVDAESNAAITSDKGDSVAMAAAAVAMAEAAAAAAEEEEEESDQEGPLLKFRGKYKSIRDRATERVIMTYQSHSDESATEMIPDEDASDFEEQLIREIAAKSRKGRSKGRGVRRGLVSSPASLDEQDDKASVRRRKKEMLKRFKKEDNFSPPSSSNDDSDSESNSSSSDNSSTASSSSSTGSSSLEDSDEIPKRGRRRRNLVDDEVSDCKRTRGKVFSKRNLGRLHSSSEESDNDSDFVPTNIKRRKSRKDLSSDEEETFKRRTKSKRGLGRNRHERCSRKKAKWRHKEEQKDKNKHKKIKDEEPIKNLSSKTVRSSASSSSDSEFDEATIKKLKVNRISDSEDATTIIDNSTPKLKTKLLCPKTIVDTDTDSESAKEADVSSLPVLSEMVPLTQEKLRELYKDDSVLAKLIHTRDGELNRKDVIEMKSWCQAATVEVQRLLEELPDTRGRHEWRKPQFNEMRNFRKGWQMEVKRFKKDAARIPARLIKTPPPAPPSPPPTPTQESAKKGKESASPRKTKGKRDTTPTKTRSGATCGFVQEGVVTKTSTVRYPTREVSNVMERFFAKVLADTDAPHSPARSAPPAFAPYTPTPRSPTGLTPTPSLSMYSDDSDRVSLADLAASDSVPISRPSIASALIRRLHRNGRGRSRRQLDTRWLGRSRAFLHPTNKLELLPTPGLATDLSVPTSAEDGRQKLADLFRREASDRYRPDAVRAGSGVSVAPSRTRTRTKAHLDAASIRAVFGADPPQNFVKEAKKKSPDLVKKEVITGIIRRKDVSVIPSIAVPSPVASSTSVGRSSTPLDFLQEDDSSEMRSERSESALGELTTIIRGGRKARRKLRKFRKLSGFDYIRRPKKKLRPDDEISVSKRRVPVRKRVLWPEQSRDVAAEVRGWVIKKSLGETPLHKAARLQHHDLVIFCLESGDFNVNAKDNAGYSPLHDACNHGHLDIAQALLAHGAHVNAAGFRGMRPLHEALENGHVEVARMLLAYGADPSLATYGGQSCAALAASDALSQRFLEQFMADLRGTNAQPWHIRGPALMFDLEKEGCNIFETPTRPSFNSDTEDSDFCSLFECSDQILPITYAIKSEEQTSSKYMLLRDVMAYAGVTTRRDLVVLAGRLETLNLAVEEFEQRAIPLVIGQPIVVEGVDGSVTLVKYTEGICRMMGVERVRMDQEE